MENTCKVLKHKTICQMGYLKTIMQQPDVASVENMADQGSSNINQVIWRHYPYLEVTRLMTSYEFSWSMNRVGVSNKFTLNHGPYYIFQVKSMSDHIFNSKGSVSNRNRKQQLNSSNLIQSYKRSAFSIVDSLYRLLNFHNNRKVHSPVSFVQQLC